MEWRSHHTAHHSIRRPHRVLAGWNWPFRYRRQPVRLGLAGWRRLLTDEVRDGRTWRNRGMTEDSGTHSMFMAWSGGGGEHRRRPLHALLLPVRACAAPAPWPYAAPGRPDRVARLHVVRLEPPPGAVNLQERFPAGNTPWRTPGPDEWPREGSSRRRRRG